MRVIRENSVRNNFGRVDGVGGLDGRLDQRRVVRRLEWQRQRGSARVRQAVHQGWGFPVFVSEADKKVYKLAGKANAKDHLDHKVQISGDVKGDTITVTEIKKAS